LQLHTLDILGLNLFNCMCSASLLDAWLDFLVFSKLMDTAFYW